MAKHTTASAAPATKAESSNVEPVETNGLPAKWKTLLALIAKTGPALSGLLTHGQLVAVEDGRAVIRYSKQHETFVKMLERNGKKDVLRDALSQVLEQPVGVRFEVDDAVVPATATTTAAVAAPLPTTSPVQSPRPAPKPAAAPPPPPPVETANTIRVTDEIRAKLYESEPLIRAVVDQLGGNIIKLEE